MILRILAVTILLFSILFWPFWLSVILALMGMIYFSFFLEAPLLFLLSDLLYGIPEPRFFNLVFISFIYASICFIVIEFIKKKTRFNSK
ncbi:MAG: hypothetical protein Q7K54_05365 [Candidatus Parcubacteria bacterium]|nr:hypothetical protein [Candidatus Parcubacteria bacterium]